MIRVETPSALRRDSGVHRLYNLLQLGFVLMMVPGTDRGVDEASKEEDKADKQYDTGQATVKSLSFSHTV